MRMKNFFGLLFLALVFVSFSAINLVAQVVDTTGVGNFSPADDFSGIAGWLKWYHALYGAMVIGWGFLAKSFGLKAKVKNFWFVVAAGGLVIAGAFVVLGFSKAFPLVFSFLAATNLYQMLFKSFPDKKQLSA